ncbi:peptide-methionine (S)-S-oxide reductase MsrA [Piscinibacter sp. Jin2]|uniref:Peptide methionine sulfoxide reductase MsrA n=1 Tax=Aquariibacter lacus TaxID=2801332 RepID=A0A9X0XFR9_9BURK|nr:peptide-methionine (S)-S-oxide reductase MsrA [Piscinibacter lacus]MBL0720097.1 peptide-methionine (S)-S-oxide reductase MsrA [Piscinibacter lacus]
MNPDTPPPPAAELATLAGGCFWCLEAVYLDVDGVLAVQSGYSQGQVASPSYEQVCTGRTGHAEVIRVRFDPERISYRTLLEIFFEVHDPSQPNRQGADVGTQYRSGIYTHSEAQAATAAEVIAARRDAGQRIVTEVEPERDYWPAEGYHQNYVAEHPNQPYCLFVAKAKVEAFRQAFPGRRKLR